MNDERLIESLERLSSWEQVVFRLKSQGESRDAIATRLSAKPRQIEMIVGNIYDKLGLAFLDDRQRRNEIYRVATCTLEAEAQDRFHWPRTQDLPTVPAPEVPSQRAQAEARNDERSRNWPVVENMHQPRNERTEEHPQANQKERTEKEEEPVSKDRRTGYPGKTENGDGKDSGRESPRSATPQAPTRSRKDIRSIGLAFLFPLALAGLCVFTILFILSDGSDEDVIAADDEARTTELDESYPSGTGEYADSDTKPLATVIQSSSPTPIPTPHPIQMAEPLARVDEPGQAIYSRFALNFKEWAERDNWTAVDELLVHNGSGDPNSIILFPYTIQRKNAAVEIEMRVHRMGGDVTSGDVGALLRVGSESAYYLGLAGQGGLESAFAESIVFDPDEGWKHDESLHASRLRANVAQTCQQQWCVLRLEAYGNQLRVLIGNEVVLETFDNRNLQPGDAGFYSSGFQIDVRDVRVYDLQ